MFRVLKFKRYNELTEATEKQTDANSKNNRNGVMHELLVGYHLHKPPRHMEKHPDVHGDSPQEAHDKLKAQMTPEEYAHAHKKAKQAAKDIHAQYKKNFPNHKFDSAHWSSKPGDMKRSTGIEASQKQDTSDIVMTSKKPDGSDHHQGVSLKNTTKGNVNVGASNHGVGTMHSKAGEHHEDHKNKISKIAPELHPDNAKKNGLGSAKARKEWMKHPDNAKKVAKIKEANGKSLVGHAESHAKELNDHLKSGDKDRINKVKQHIRDTLAAKKTPMEKEGHSNIKATTYMHKGEPKTYISNPGKDHEDIFKDPDFHHHIEIKHSGTGHSIHYKGKKIAKFTYKFNSQSDPRSSITAVGNTAHKMKDGKVVKD
jgi:hypothetical protein